MGYVKPTLNEYGLELPSYDDIISYLKEQCKSIYGDDIYLEDDSQDYQFLSLFSLLAYDIGQCILLDYNSHNPDTAIGTALDRVASLCGITRIVGTPSTATLRCSGTPGTIVEYGAAQDANGNTWQLEKYFVIGDSGYADVIASCLTDGAIQAPAGTITTIKTPTAGWKYVTNQASASIGMETETDAHLRARIVYSASKGSQTVLEGLLAALWEANGVLRVKLYENYTSEIDSKSIPPHSLAVIIEGGDETEIANTIYKKKTLGTGLYGTESITIDTQDGQTAVINFSRPTYIIPEIMVTITKALDTFNEDIVSATIKSNIVSAINDLDIGQTLYAANLYSAALAAIDNISEPTYFVNIILINDDVSLDCNYNQLIKAEESKISVLVN